MISRDEAIKLVDEHIKDERHRKHVLAVEAIMRALARRLGEDEELWGLVGLLHDLDYEETKDSMERHGLLAAEWLRGKLPDEALEAIKAHNELTGVTSDSRLANALRAADQASGLIVATALVMPSRKLKDVKVKSVLKKFKQKDFARGVNRDKIRLAEKLGLTLEEFFQIALEGMQAIAGELGL